MLSRSMVAGAIAAATLPALAQQQSAPVQAAVPSAVPAARISQDRIDGIRHAMLSQIAAYDAAEKSMRRPTEAEAAALSAGAFEATAKPLALPGGGLALRRDLSSLSYLIVDLGENGAKTMRHGSSKSVAPAAKGGQDVR